jgi:hypothetical protein
MSKLNPAYTRLLYDLRALVGKIDVCIVEARQAGADHLIKGLLDTRDAMLAFVDKAQKDAPATAPKVDLHRLNT